MANTPNEDLLQLFGQLFMQRRFVWAAIQTQQRRDGNVELRGPLRVLVLLKDGQQLTNADIAERLDIRPSSVTALVNRLVEAGLAERNSAPDDKRVQMISLTDKGQQALDDAQNTRAEFTDNAFAALSDEERAQLQSLLAKLVPDVERQEDEHRDDDHDGRGFGRGFHGPHGHHGPHGDWPYGGGRRHPGFDRGRF